MPIDPARHRVVVTAGHVDHGKSTLVRALTGMEPDRLAEERRRGLTLDLGYAWTALDGHELPIAFVDVPGHERFVSTMLAGAGPAPTALLIVAADDGWSAQSSEHRDVLALTGVPLLAVVISKAATVAPERVDEVAAGIDDALAGTHLHGAPIVVTDALRGEGIDQLTRTLRRRLDDLPPPEDVGRARLWVDRAFAVAGAGTVVTGTLGGGTLHLGDQVTVLPQGGRHRVRGLQCLGRDVPTAGPGTRVAVNLAGLDHAEVARGHAVVDAGPWRATTEVDLWLHALPGRRIRDTGAWHVHVGTARSVARLRPVLAPLDGDRDDARAGPVRATLESAVPLLLGDRIVVRDAGRREIAAGGVVVDPDPRRRPRGQAARNAATEHLRAVADADDRQRVAALLAARGGAAPADRLLAAAADARLPAGVRSLGDHLIDEASAARATAVVEALGPGVHDRDAVAAALTDQDLPAGLTRALLDELIADGTVTRTSGGVALPQYADAESSQRSRRADALISALTAEPLTPPPLAEAAAKAGVDHRELSQLVQAGEVVRAGQVAFSRAGVARAVEVLRERFGDGRTFTASEAKQAWGTTRRYAIPLLEHLDRTGVTVFDGQLRHLRDAPRR